MKPILLILASGSPRRKLLLEQIGLKFKTWPSNVEEPAFSGTDPSTYASDLALLKAREISDQAPEAIVVGSDTIVVVDNVVLGKPVDAESAHKMLRMLSGRSHEVITAYCFVCKGLSLEEVHYVSTQVHFRELLDTEIERYIATGAPFDKAGSYGIQDYSSIFVDYIEGCFYNVVGLPLSDFNARLDHFLTINKLVLQ